MKKIYFISLFLTLNTYSSSDKHYNNLVTMFQSLAQKIKTLTPEERQLVDTQTSATPEKYRAFFRFLKKKQSFNKIPADELLIHKEEATNINKFILKIPRLQRWLIEEEKAHEDRLQRFTERERMRVNIQQDEAGKRYALSQEETRERFDKQEPIKIDAILNGSPRSPISPRVPYCKQKCDELLQLLPISAQGALAKIIYSRQELHDEEAESRDLISIDCQYEHQKTKKTVDTWSTTAEASDNDSQ